jgi:hypothetical protein
MKRWLTCSGVHLGLVTQGKPTKVYEVPYFVVTHPKLIMKLSMCSMVNFSGMQYIFAFWSRLWKIAKSNSATHA